MNLSIVILVLLPVFLDVVYGDTSTHNISSVLEIFPEFKQTNNKINKLETSVSALLPEVKQMNNRIKELEKVATPSTRCAFGFVSHANYCFRYVHLAATWIEAQMYCGVFGGWLLRIETPEKLYAIRHYLESVIAADHIWIGSTDILTEGIWHWTKGNGDQRMIGNPGLGIWASGQPDDYASDEDCGTLKNVNGRYLGNDDVCLNKRAFLCEAK